MADQTSSVSQAPETLPLEAPPGGSGFRRRHRRPIRIVSWVVTVISVLALLAAGSAYGLYLHYNGQIHRFSLGHNTGGAPDYGGSENFLLAGDDSRTGLTPKQLREYNTTQDGGGINTDVMMVAHVLPQDRGVDVVSIPRDSWVSIPGHGYGKINSAYAIGGAPLMVSTVERVTGLHIDHVIMVNFAGFVNISDAIGGVRVCVPPGPYGNGFHDSYSGVNLNPGWHTIKGAVALAFVRQRHDLPTSDLGRILLQHEYISAAMRKIETAGVLLNPVRLNDLLNAVTKSLSVDTGLGLVDLERLAEALRQVHPGAVKFLTYPVANAAYWPSGTPYVGEEAVLLNPKLGQLIFNNIENNLPPNHGRKLKHNTSVVSAATRTCAE